MEQMDTSITIDAIRIEAARQLNPERKAMLGQFMTPARIARFMASLFDKPKNDVHLLDAGAGTGSLTSAFLETHLHCGTKVKAWEIDEVLQGYLADTLRQFEQQAKERGIELDVTLQRSDFIKDAVLNIASGKGPRFTHAVLNPPYKKINQGSDHRLLLRKVGIETVNLYTAFVALSILLMETHGEIVAIIPRSFCNGTYYRPFRELLLRKCAIKHIHLFESRKKAFRDDEVLQENIIIHLVRSGAQGAVAVSTSHDSQFDNYEQQMLPFSDIVKPNDPESFIHIPIVKQARKGPDFFSCTLKDIGLQVCTGPVVDFRVKAFWSKDLTPKTVPLLYPHHFAKGSLSYPKEGKKPNALTVHPDTEKWLMPSGCYVLVKRFSSKEERRRIVAYVLDPTELPACQYGFENHWDVFHVKKQGLEEGIARGLAYFLNSTAVDEHFRVFSGHTQVNATDLRAMKYPSRSQLVEIAARAGKRSLSQKDIDQLVAVVEDKGGGASLPVTDGEGVRAKNGKERGTNSRSAKGSSGPGDATATAERKKRIVSSGLVGFNGGKELERVG